MCQHCFVCIWSVELECPPFQGWRPRLALVPSVRPLHPDGITAADHATMQYRGIHPNVSPVVLGGCAQDAGILWEIALRERCHHAARDRKSTRLNSSHGYISYAVFCLTKKNLSK